MRASKNEKRIQRTATLFCVVLFVVFSYTFLAVYQAPLLEIFYDRVANGKLQYNAHIVAGIITALLTLLTLWLNRMAGFKREWTAVAYLPSCIILAFITDIDRTLYTGGFSYLAWSIIFAVAILFYLFMAFILHRVLFAQIKNLDMEGSRIMWRNMLLLTLLFFLTGTLSSAEEDIKNEAMAYKYYKRGNIDKALKVGRNAASASRELTSSRAYYLALKGELGERLFAYPQYYGSEALLPSFTQTTPLSPDTVYSQFDIERRATDTTLEFLTRAASADSVSRNVADYYLSALLLEKRLDEFMGTLPRYYNVEEADALPKNYKEAILLYNDIAADSTIVVTDEELVKRYTEMRAVESEYPDILVRSNIVHSRYGKSYWYYYNYGH